MNIGAGRQDFVGPADLTANGLRVYALWPLALGLPTCNYNFSHAGVQGTCST